MGKASRKKALRRMGVGDYKLSEALVELVAPLLHDGMDLQERQSLFMVATIAWNIALFPREQRGRQILNFVGGLPEMPSQLEEEITRMLDGQPASPALPPEKLEFMELLISLMARKQERFPHDRRLVGDVELREQDGQYHLKVASRLAPEDFGADPA